MSRSTVFFVGLALGALGGAAAHRLFFSGGDEWTRYEDVREFAEQEYVRTAQRPKLADDALKGMLAGLDRYSRFYDAREVAELQRETGGHYRGIGVVLKRPISEGRVLFTLPGSPAESGGLRVGDTLLEIDGRPFSAVSEEDLRRTLAMDTDEVLRLRVRGIEADERELEVQRSFVLEPTVRGERLLDDTHHVGYIALHSFSDETPKEFDAAFDRLVAGGMRSLVIDLRGNGGGVLRSAVRIANRFLAAGVIVSTEGRRTTDVRLAEPAFALHAGFPLAVLVDEETASASEVLAGALQDHRAAVVVGAPTWGKGTVQTIRSFPRYATAAKVTTSFYYTPAHRNLEHGEQANFGIAPDVWVEEPPEDGQRIRAFLARQPPPHSALPSLRAWEARDHVVLIDDPPADRRLDTALQLMRGETLAADLPATKVGR